MQGNNINCASSLLDYVRQFSMNPHTIMDLTTPYSRSTPRLYTRDFPFVHSAMGRVALHPYTPPSPVYSDVVPYIPAMGATYKYVVLPPGILLRP